LQKHDKLSHSARMACRRFVVSIGDLMVDASYKTLQDQFFQSLADAGIKRVL
jgi:hypothetical protein